MGQVRYQPRQLSEWLREEASGPGSMNPDHQDIYNKLAASAKAIDDLVSLVRHCWVHSGYRNCGRSQMGSEQKLLYDDLVATAVIPECCVLHVWELDEEDECAVCKICGNRDSVDVLALDENGMEESGDDDPEENLHGGPSNRRDGA